MVNQEQWKDILGYEGTYQISSLGRIKSFLKRKSFLKPNITKKGYVRVSLTRNGIPHRVYVHRLVGQAFVSNPENKPFINHKNGIKTDNFPENLEWCTDIENKVHSCYFLGNYGLKKVKLIFPNGDEKEFPSYTEAAKSICLTQTYFSSLIKNKKGYKGITFKTSYD